MAQRGMILLQDLDLKIATVILIPMIFSAALLSFVTIMLLFARAKIYHYPVYKPMLLNLFLAWIPIACSGIALFIFLTQKAVTPTPWIVVLLLLVWFVFFPNSTYLITEFHHLKEDVTEVPFWFDTIVILSLALCGVMLGCFSLFLVQRLLLLYITRVDAWIIFILYVFLSNIGIYIGRFLRFNSWDIVTNPLGLIHHLLSAFRDRKQARNIFLFSSLFTVFLLTFYLFLYSAVEPAILVLEMLIKQNQYLLP
jgi:uncharacterized membrane protein